MKYKNQLFNIYFLYIKANINPIPQAYNKHQNNE